MHFKEETPMKTRIFLAVLFFILTVSSHAQIVSSSSPGIPEKFNAIRLRSVVAAGTVKIPNMKAVLIGGPIDGDNGSWTTKEIQNLKLAASALRINGVQVYEFYAPNNNWDKIKEAADGAQILMYRGHGVYDGSTPPKWVGGFALKDKFASSEDIQKDLKLAPGAIVMLYGCFTAGNSGFDIGQIDEREADRRVAMYARPFIKMGCSGYYANWFGDAFQQFVVGLFSGKSLGESYKAYSDFNAETVNMMHYPDDESENMWVDHDNWDGKVAYNNAFVGRSDMTLQSLFSGASASAAAGSSKNADLSINASNTGTAMTSKKSSNSNVLSMTYLTALEKQVVAEINRVRTNPRAYAKHVKELKKYFDGNLLKFPGEIALQTNEGEAAVDECYEALMAAEPVDSLKPSKGMSRAAKDHAEDQGETTSTGHTGSDGSTPFDRLGRYGEWLRTAGENIDYGNNNGRRIVLSLLIDDGVASRGHRKNILNPEYKVIGVACGPHQQYRHMCVIDFAGGFKKKAMKTRGDDEEGEE
jgi:uncharacterized protein YkwD